MGVPWRRLWTGARAAVLAAAACGAASCGREDAATGPGGSAAGPGGGPAPALEPGIALAFVYDTSGSMSEGVADGKGGQSPKFQVANRAFLAIVEKLRAFVAAPPEGASGGAGAGAAPPRLDTMLVRFEGAGGGVALPLAPFDAAAMRTWIEGFRKPAGPTPLGDALRIAGEAVLGSKVATKHVLLLTDGKNTAGPDPAAVLQRLRQDAERQGVGLSAHFVAFDVDAAEFRDVAALGATLVSASDEAQLKDRMEYILEEKILLEVASPRTPGQPPR